MKSKKNICDTHKRSLTIAGGTAEIQLNIIAKRVLGSPG